MGASEQHKLEPRRRHIPCRAKRLSLEKSQGQQRGSWVMQPAGADPPATQGTGRKEVPQGRTTQTAHLELATDTRAVFAPGSLNNGPSCNLVWWGKEGVPALQDRGQGTGTNKSA